MAASTFQTNPFNLHQLLEDCQRGVLQLPGFRRSWVKARAEVPPLLHCFFGRAFAGEL